MGHAHQNKNKNIPTTNISCAIRTMMIHLPFFLFIRRTNRPANKFYPYTTDDDGGGVQCALNVNSFNFSNWLTGPYTGPGSHVGNTRTLLHRREKLRQPGIRVKVNGQNIMKKKKLLLKVKQFAWLTFEKINDEKQFSQLQLLCMTPHLKHTVIKINCTHTSQKK